MAYGRWALAVLFGLLWATCAIANASIALRPRPAKEEHKPSLVPIVGGIFALLAYAACPWTGRSKPLFLLAALFLDLGSLPYLLLLVAVGLSTALSSGMLYQKAAQQSWGVRWGLGFLIWLALGSVVIHATERLRFDSVYAFGLFTLLFWAAYVVFLIRVGKYKRSRSEPGTGKQQSK